MHSKRYLFPKPICNGEEVVYMANLDQESADDDQAPEKTRKAEIHAVIVVVVVVVELVTF